MSRRKLTIVVTCTDRKSATPAQDLMARNLPRGPAAERVGLWREALSRATELHSLTDLYRGETWSQVRALALKASHLGYEPSMLVASAGLGLQCVSDQAPSYAATFSSGHPDSVGGSIQEAQAWWSALPRTAIPRGGHAIWVLSAAYSQIVSEQLMRETLPASLLVFGGSKEVPDSLRIPSDRSLRRALGGTATSINVRSAAQWLTLSDGADPFDDAARDRWRVWSAEKRQVEIYDRRPMTDDGVLEFVRHLRQQDPTVSKTRALRVLRADGMACEQQRFSTLFEQAVAR